MDHQGILESLSDMSAALQLIIFSVINMCIRDSFYYHPSWGMDIECIGDLPGHITKCS